MINPTGGKMKAEEILNKSKIEWVKHPSGVEYAYLTKSDVLKFLEKYGKLCFEAGREVEYVKGSNTYAFKKYKSFEEFKNKK